MKINRILVLVAALVILGAAVFAAWQLGAVAAIERALHGAGGADAGDHDHSDFGAADEHGDAGAAIVHVDAGEREHLGLETAAAGPGALHSELSFPGEVKMNADRLAHIVPHAPGIVRAVYSHLGDTVRAGDVMAELESIELGEAKVAHLSLRQKVELAQADLARAETVHENTNKLLDFLTTSPELERLHEAEIGEMGEYRGVLISAYAEMVTARSAFEREKQLREKQITSEEEFLRAESDLKKAAAGYFTARDSIAYSASRALLEAERGVLAAKYELKASERRLHVLGLTDEDVARLTEGGQDDERLAWYALRAPFDGTVVNKHITLGESLDGAEMVFVVADLSTVWVEASVYQKDLGAVREGQSATICTATGTHAGDGFCDTGGTITYIAPVLGETTRTAVARVVLPNPDGFWRPGLFVTAHIAADDRPAALLVPKSAVQTLGTDKVVFVPAEDGFAARPIVAGRSDALNVEILAGLSAGDRVVTDGAFELKAKLVTGALGAHAGHGH